MNSSIFFNNGFRRAALASVVAFGAFGASTGFAAPASTTSNTSATVVQPINIAKAQDLTFGEFAAGTGGSVVLTTGGSASPTGDVVLTAGTPTAAQFTVTGVADASFSIGISDNELTYTAPDTTVHTMTLTTKHDLDGSTQNDPASGTLTGGTRTLYVGGTLSVNNAQAPGLYEGTITATVNYN